MGDGVVTANVGNPIEFMMRLFIPSELAWVGTLANTKVIVYAGRDGSDEKQGLVIVVREGTIWDPIGARFESPARDGGLRIVDAVGARLVLQAADGGRYYFDVPAGQFVDSISVVVPTMTPGPTITPRPTGPVYHDDDAPDSPMTVFERSPVNSNLFFQIQGKDDEDWFSFYLPEGRASEAQLASPTGSVIFELYRSEGLKLVEGATVDEGETYSIHAPGGGGFYYVRVAASPADSDAAYLLRVQVE
jgi:hypothetical protein